GACCELFIEHIVRVSRDEYAVWTDAGLPAVAELRGHQTFDRGVDICVVEDDERRVAAKLQRELLEGIRAALRKVLADRCRAGERDLAHARIVQPDIDDLGGPF